MAEQTEGQGGGFSFTKKLGPMPLWAWMGIVLALAVVYSQWSKNKKAASTSTTGTTTGTTSPTDQTPPFIIQNYVQPGVPGATGAPGATGPAGPAGPVGPPSPVPIQGGNPPKGPGGPIIPIGPVGGQPPPVNMPTPKQPVIYRVKPGDTLSSIASAYHVNGGWQALYNYNIGTGPGTANRDASTIATLKQRGPNLIYSNEAIYIPQ